MKKLSFILCMLFVLSLCACTPLMEKKDTSIEIPDPDAQYPAKVDTTEGAEDWIMTDYYHLSVPDSWLMNCIYTTQELKDGGHVLDIYEKEAYWDNGGLLWSVRLFPEGEDFSSYPNHTAYGILETESQTYYVVVLTPTDVQYTDKTKAQYNKMFSQLGSIMDTLDPKDSYKYWIPQVETISPVIETDYYSLTLPAEWLDKCVWEIFNKDDGTYILNLYELTAHEEMGAGKLCSLMLFPSGDTSYKELPDNQLLAVVDTPDGSYSVIALFPTDVQFSPDTAESYNAMAAQVTDVLYTLSPAAGMEMAMPAPVA